jgi:hypothetical protein
MATQREYLEVRQAAQDEVLVEISEGETGDLVATVAWGDWVSDGVTRHGDSVGPMGVGEALRRADEVASLYGFARVVVSLGRAHTWNPNWGTLRRHAPAAIGEDLLEADDGDEGRAPTSMPVDGETGRTVDR